MLRLLNGSKWNGWVRDRLEGKRIGVGGSYCNAREGRYLVGVITWWFKAFPISRIASPSSYNIEGRRRRRKTRQKGCRNKHVRLTWLRMGKAENRASREGRQEGHHSTVGKGNTFTADRPTTALRFYWIITGVNTQKWSGMPHSGQSIDDRNFPWNPLILSAPT